MKTFVELQFEVMYIYEFQTKENSYVRHLFSLSLKLCMFMSLKQNRMIMKTFVESLFEVIYVYVFQPKLDSYEGIC